RKRTDDPTRFQLAVIYVPPGTTQEIPVEVFENLSMTDTDSRFVVRVLEAESALVRAQVLGTPPHTAPADTAVPTIKMSGAANLDGTVLKPNDPAFHTQLAANASTGGVNFLRTVDLVNLLCVPGETDPAVLGQLQKICHDLRAFLIADTVQDVSFTTLQGGPDTQLTQADALNAALYYPWVLAADPLQENRIEQFPPCGFVAGIYARTDATRGVWKAPAGIDATLTGAAGLRTVLTDAQNGTLNVQAINCLRTFAVYGTVVWGARTLHGHDQRGSEWKYIPIRRLALFIEESLFRGTKWVVFEPNDEPLWAQIRLNVGSFMNGLFRQGAFQGRSPREAYFVKCDATTTTEIDRVNGVVNILVGFAPLKPAEFVVIKIQQIAGQIET
ncbi:MAG TPA: phage tail sheath subtilisin-like domain-containing protein, partial [Longimicrobium sp.]|nr:phage tail sheath subtilisin-like domain-containing protein [Longimicrobium sp.]